MSCRYSRVIIKFQSMGYPILTAPGLLVVTWYDSSENRDSK